MTTNILCYNGSLLPDATLDAYWARYRQNLMQLNSEIIECYIGLKSWKRAPRRS